MRYCSEELEQMGGKPKLPEQLELLELLSKLVKIISSQGSPTGTRNPRLTWKVDVICVPFFRKSSRDEKDWKVYFQ